METKKRNESMRSHIGEPMEGLAEFCRIVAAQGAVLLKNEEQTLPLQRGEKVAVFGRCQLDYYKSGTGSGGAVNVAYTTNLLDGLRSMPGLQVDEELAGIYEQFVREHPFDNGGGGWAAEPWYQREMPLADEVARAAAERSDKAVIVIGRTAGEDQDNADAPGSYRLTEEELQMMETVCRHFDKVAVALNVSNIIDMSWLNDERYCGNVRSVIYLWHGGIEGGNAAADVLAGRVSPSGKLSDTIAYSLQDYPSTAGYGDRYTSYYGEDIYVGYRYFETFAPEKVQFPFGYGLSYTTFQIDVPGCQWTGQELIVEAVVKNTGSRYAGKEVVQVYVEAPQGRLGKASRVLVGYGKTKLLSPGELDVVEIHIPVSRLASYDDSGITGHKSCYVLEAGEYRVYVGNSVRDAAQTSVCDSARSSGEDRLFLWIPELLVLERLQEAAAPEKTFDRIRPGERKPDGTYEISREPVPQKTVDLAARIQANLPEELPITGDQGIRFADVRAGKASLETFVAQFTVEELATIVRGEGMCSDKVTPGTAAAFGGVSDSLLEYGVPIACAADGPSGIRMDNGAKATQVPIGTLLACSWDLPLVEELFALQGQELVRNEIDTLLGPGINIHRNPLNGRNFEYFSEDPLLTGTMAAAVVRGIGRHGAAGTVKHFACNNQETARHSVDAIVSERALREIYLKGFEIAVKEGHAVSIMSSYNPVNGHWTASNYDLDTTILRKEWGFSGIVMTDWWAKMNDVVEGGEGNNQDTRSMVRAQNDLYMVVNNNGAEMNPHGDNTLKSVKDGTLTVGELQQCAKNILRFLMRSHAAERPVRVKETIRIQGILNQDGEQQKAAPDSVPLITQQQDSIFVPVGSLCGDYLEGEKAFRIRVQTPGVYEVGVKVTSKESDLAQMACQVSLNGVDISTFQINGTWGRWQLQKLAKVELTEGEYILRLKFVRPGMQIESMDFTSGKDHSGAGGAAVFG